MQIISNRTYSSSPVGGSNSNTRLVAREHEEMFIFSTLNIIFLQKDT